jgi:hypothetical protein
MSKAVTNFAGSPELRLIVAAATPRMHAAGSAVTNAIFDGVRDWNAVGELAARHGLRPLCFEFIRKFNSGSVPEDWLQSFSSSIRAISQRSLALSAELVLILDILERAGIRAIPYKGPALAAQAFGDIARREYGDLDLLVHQEEISTIAGALQREGYLAAVPLERTLKNIPGQYSFSRPGGPPVEFHTEKTLRYYPRPLDLAGMESHLVTVRLGDRSLRTFAPEDALTILGVHGIKHLWARLMWVADIAWLIGSRPQFDWSAAMECAEEFGATRMMLTGAGLASELLDAELPEDIKRLVRENRGVAFLMREARKELFSSGAGAAQRAIFRIRSVDGLNAGLRYLLRLTTSPAEDDWAGGERGQISAALSRPARLLRKYGIRRANSSRNNG